MIYKLSKMNSKIKEAFNSRLKEYNITFSQWEVLKTININSLNKEVTLNFIVKELSSDKATITEIIKKLETKGFIIKTTSKDDKRKKIIKIKDDKQIMCEKFLEIQDEIINNFFKNLTVDEKKQLTDLINKI